MSPRLAVPGRRALVRRQRAALEPVRAAMLREASAQAEEVLAAARRDAAARIARARAEAEEAIARARAQGQAQAAPVALAELSRGHREAHGILLGAQARARAEMEARIRSAIGGLRDEPGYTGLRTRLRDLAGLAAGPGAAVIEDHRGGVLVRSAGMLVDCSLPRLADRAIEALGPEITKLTAL